MRPSPWRGGLFTWGWSARGDILTRKDLSMHARTSRPWLVVAGLSALAISVTGTLASAGPSPDDLSDKGGATRNDGDRTNAVRKAVVGGHARNVILLIGDGMGDSEITS